MPRSERRIVSNVLEVSAIKLGAPVILVVGIESYDLPFHNSFPKEARIAFSLMYQPMSGA